MNPLTPPLPFVHAIFSQTKSLWSELEATREVATSTRQVYEGTVKQREDWRKALQREERAKTEATKRYARVRCWGFLFPFLVQTPPPLPLAGGQAVLSNADNVGQV